ARSRLLRVSSAVLGCTAAPLTFIDSTFAFWFRKKDNRGLSPDASKIFSARSGPERLTRRNFACTSTFCSSGATRALMSYFLISNSCAKAREAQRQVKTRLKNIFFILCRNVILGQGRRDYGIDGMNGTNGITL